MVWTLQDLHEGKLRVISYHSVSSQVNHDGLVDRLVRLGANRRVDEQRVHVLRPAVPAVDVTEGVDFRSRPLDSLHKLLAPDVLAAEMRGDLVVYPHRGAVCDQDVQPLGDQVPLLPDGLATVEVESPVHERGLPRAAVYPQPLDGCGAVLKVDDLGLALVADQPLVENRQRVHLALLEHPVVVARDENLVLVRKGAEPHPERGDFDQTPDVGAVAAVDQDVAVRDRRKHLVVQPMRVGNENYPHTIS